jgi:hypothetical protein
MTKDGARFASSCPPKQGARPSQSKEAPVWRLYIHAPVAFRFEN